MTDKRRIAEIAKRPGTPLPLGWSRWNPADFDWFDPNSKLSGVTTTQLGAGATDSGVGSGFKIPLIGGWAATNLLSGVYGVSRTAVLDLDGNALTETQVPPTLFRVISRVAAADGSAYRVYAGYYLADTWIECPCCIARGANGTTSQWFNGHGRIDGATTTLTLGTSDSSGRIGEGIVYQTGNNSAFIFLGGGRLLSSSGVAQATGNGVSTSLAQAVSSGTARVLKRFIAAVRADAASASAETNAKLEIYSNPGLYRAGPT